MTYTIKLTDGGISFDRNGRLEMVGAMNQISREEVEQRTEIRFLTQTRHNILHPFDGFDYYALVQLKQSVKDEYNISNKSLLEKEIRSTLHQDPDISADTVDIKIRRGADRNYDAVVLYEIKGGAQQVLKYAARVTTF